MSFDLLAPHYRWMEWALAGKKLQRCRTAFLDDIAPPSRVLFLGEGNGRCLAAVAERFPGAALTCVDSSAAMLAQARRRFARAGFGQRTVDWVHADVHAWMPRGSFDLIVSHFFLDCFEREQLRALLPRIASAAAPNATWLLADFCEP